MKDVISLFALKVGSAPALGVAALLFAFALAPASAFAHAEVVSSTPAEGATVAPGLTSITVTFDEEVSVEQSNAQLMMADGAAVSGATSAVSRDNRKMMTIQTSALSEGKYQVKWHALTEDDNGISDGAINFTVSASGSSSSGAMQGSASMGEHLPQTGQSSDGLLIAASLLGALLLLALGVRLRRQVQG